MKHLSEEIEVSKLAPGTKFVLVLEGWNRFYGTKSGKVLYNGPGSTLVRWQGEPKEHEFTDGRTGNKVSFVTDG
jgi:hypothetical protein